MQNIRTHIIAKLLTLFMAFWVLVLSSGVSVNVHFCQNVVKSFSILSEAPNCHEMMANTSSSCHFAKKSCKNACSASKIQKEDNKPCCTNKDVQLELDTDLPHFEIVSTDFSLEDDFWAVQVTPIVYNFDIQKPVEKTAFKHYRPPPLVGNYIVLYQQFLC